MTMQLAVGTPWTALTSTAVGCGLLGLAMRVPGYPGVAATVLVGLIGLSVPVRVIEPPSPLMQRLAIAGAGIAVFLIAGLASPVPSIHPGVLAVVAAALAAIGEEAFFRRLAFGLLLKFGVVAAVVGAAVLFALVHVPGYGPHSLPVNLTAGLLFGWQRHVTGDWRVPAATHITANMINLL